MKVSTVESHTDPPAAPAQGRETWPMFDRIAKRYDLLNRLLSFRQDVGWRRTLARHLPEGDSLRVLDLATGTGDLLLALQNETPRVRSGAGLDMSWKMLELAREKFLRLRIWDRFQLVRGDATALAVGDETFDAVTIAFGIRNVSDVPAALSEMRRLLRTGGRALILEFSLPKNSIIRFGYLLYFRRVLPFVGGAISGDHGAYRYLNESVESFPYGEAFLDLMRAAGFTRLKAIPLSFGIATLYVGDK